MKLFCALFLFMFQTMWASDLYIKDNLPWYPSLAAFEHYNSGRSHVFPQAKFGGAFKGNNQVYILTSSASYPSGYNMAYLDSQNAFIYGGGYGDEPGSIGAFVAKVNPHTLEPIWYNQLINTRLNEEWDYPGSMAILRDGFIYVIYGYRLSKIDPETGVTLNTLQLPTGGGSKENTAYNGFNATADGVLVMKGSGLHYPRTGCRIRLPRSDQCYNLHISFCKSP